MSPGNTNASKRAHLSLLLAYLNESNDAVFVIDSCMHLLMSNKTLANWLADSSSHANIASRLIGIEESIVQFSLQLQAALAGTSPRFECLIRPEGGLPRWVEISLNSVNIPDHETEILGVVRDISVHKSEVTQLKHQAIHDELTGLLNRREFTRRLQFLMSESNLVHHTLLYLDLDQFKIVNDTCGHIAGDELLSQLAAIIQKQMRTTDTLARLGGDEFGVIFENCAQEVGIVKASAILDAISNFQFDWDGKHFKIGVSIGVASITPNSDGSECVLSSADAACYVAKEKGRNRIQVFASDEECSFRRREMDWISRITDAFEADRFRLYYQHILPVTSGYACYEHHEILLRMLDDGGNPIPPSEFILAAEKYHLMPLIDRWVIRTLFAHKSRCLMNGEHYGDGQSGPLCSINLSGASLNDDFFLDFLKDQIIEHDIPPHLICFEVTETVAINNLTKVAKFMSELRADGFRFALDDFGSGMSSFAYLKSLPVDFLKIDGSIIVDMANNNTDYLMVEAIYQIAKAMKIQTIAEYVENNSIMDKLKLIGVDFAQGYEIHTPECLH
ncbi:putative bifunctional diguanylate cyclase/phosphodiesterase [Sulfurirhabdus autotrophica]|uniref:Diguanylate cyclase (GGDEF)-like protein n=1 Tax=Sulfurirhabdus autotrophica TaxID=1706046 RepID=A0A4R3Y1K9_9PROT|nr:EAL domain-containing protein [Sulfurirhabdus autotrophica]TCV85407.1 diguanylate cyclase (GGDEF)-like protein [Sulfurirhabdus autotrophica]